MEPPRKVLIARIVNDPEGAPEGEPCAICYEVPTTYGLLTSCDHVFCLSTFYILLDKPRLLICGQAVSVLGDRLEIMEEVCSHLSVEMMGI